MMHKDSLAKLVEAEDGVGNEFTCIIFLILDKITSGLPTAQKSM